MTRNCDPDGYSFGRHWQSSICNLVVKKHRNTITEATLQPHEPEESEGESGESVEAVGVGAAEPSC